MSEILPLVIAVIGSSALWQFGTYLIDRFDKKRKSNEDIVKEIDKVSKKVDDLSNKVDENQAILARTHILRFSDEISNHINHSNDYWRQTLQDCDTYERFCEEHPNFRNNYTVMANKHIKETYAKLLRENKL